MSLQLHDGADIPRGALHLNGLLHVAGPLLRRPHTGPCKGWRCVTASCCLHIQLTIREDLHVVQGQLQQCRRSQCPVLQRVIQSSTIGTITRQGSE